MIVSIERAYEIFTLLMKTLHFAFSIKVLCSKYYFLWSKCSILKQKPVLLILFPMERSSNRKRARWLINLKMKFAFGVGKNLEGAGAVFYTLPTVS